MENRKIQKCIETRQGVELMYLVGVQNPNIVLYVFTTMRFESARAF